MGTTLHAVLEIHCDKVVDERGEVYAIERWEEFGRWEFEKNYDLMSCLWPAPCVYYNDVIYQSSLPDFMKALLAVFKQYDDHFVDKELVDTLTVD